MSARTGPSQFAAFTAAALATSSGRTMALGNGNTCAVLNTALITYVATASVGNRIPIIRVIAPASVSQQQAAQTLWQMAAGTAITASQTSILAIGAGVPASTVANPLMQFLTLPFDLPLPIGAQLQVFDQANIDVNDTVAMVANLAL